MNKSEFLTLLHSHLSDLPPEERNELMEDYEAHFAFALQNGRSEADVILELGHPVELAKEALGNRIPQEPVYWFGPGSPSYTHVPDPGPVPVTPVTPVAPHRGSFATAMVYTGLFFVDITIGPLLLALWSLWFGLAALAVGGLISPLALGMEYLWYGELNKAKAFAVLALVGIGILVSIVSKRAFKGVKNLTAGFWTWHTRTVRGEKRYE